MPYYDPSKNKPQGLYFSKPPFEPLLFVWKEIWAIDLMGGFLHLEEGSLPSFFFFVSFSHALYCLSAWNRLTQPVEPFVSLLDSAVLSPCTQIKTSAHNTKFIAIF